MVKKITRKILHTPPKSEREEIRLAALFNVPAEYLEEGVDVEALIKTYLKTENLNKAAEAGKTRWEVAYTILTNRGIPV